MCETQLKKEIFRAYENLHSDGKDFHSSGNVLICVKIMFTIQLLNKMLV